MWGQADFPWTFAGAKSSILRGEVLDLLGQGAPDTVPETSTASSSAAAPAATAPPAPMRRTTGTREEQQAPSADAPTLEGVATEAVKEDRDNETQLGPAESSD